MLIYGPEPPLNIVILGFVKSLQLLCLGGSFIDRDRAVAVAFARGICPNEIDFAGGLELGRELVRIVFASVEGRLSTFDVG